jgi:hypothetical protein
VSFSRFALDRLCGTKDRLCGFVIGLGGSDLWFRFFFESKEILSEDDRNKMSRFFLLQNEKYKKNPFRSSFEL